MATKADPPARMAYHAMISYCWKDKDLAQSVAARLRSSGFDVWIDTDGMTEDIYESMKQAVLSSHAIIPLLSEGYVQSENCNLELKFAKTQRKPLLPVRLSHSDSVENSVAAFLTAGLLFFDFSDRIWTHPVLRDKAFTSLTAALHSVVKGNNPVSSSSGSGFDDDSASSPLQPPSVLAKPGECFPHMPMRIDVPNWIDRSDLWKAIDADLEASKIAVLQGVGGSGKTFTAMKYAHRAMGMGTHVSWLAAKSRAALAGSLDSFVVEMYKDVEDDADSGDLDRLVGKLALYLRTQSQQPRLLVLDNVDHVEDVYQLLAAVGPIGHVRVLITTRVRLQLPHASSPIKATAVSFPDFDSCRAFFQRIPGRAVSDSEAKVLFALLGGLPLRLAVAAAFLGSNLEMPVSEYVGLVTREKARLVPNPELYPEVSVSLDSLQRRSANALDLVRLLAHLDPDKTFVDSFRSSLEEMKKFRLASIALVGAKWPSLESFDFELQAMARLQLITYDGFAISMHRCIQAVILEQNAVPTAKSERFKKAYAQKVEANFSVIRALKGNDLAKLQGVVQHLSELSLAAHTLAFQRGDKGVFMLAGALRDNSTLKILDLSFNYVGDDGVIAIASALKTNTALTDLTLSFSYFGDKGAEALSEILGRECVLGTLDLAGNRFKSAGAIKLAGALKANTSLKRLVLKYNEIDAVGGVAVAEALQGSTTLEVLNLDGCLIRDAGARCIADVLRANSVLHTLDLSRNEITSDGLRALAGALAVNKSLQALALRHNVIEDEEMSLLAGTLASNESLKFLSLRAGVAIGYVGMMSIAKALGK